MRSLTHRRAGSIGIAMALALCITAPTGAEEGSLCEALTLEDVSAIVDLPWELSFDNATGCGYREPEGHPFVQHVAVQYQDGATLAELVADEGSREVLVGEHRGVFTGETLWVQVGDQLFVLQGGFADPDVQSRIDLEGFLVAVARSAVDDLPEREGFFAGPRDRAAEVEAAGLPQIEAIEWDIVLDRQGEEVIDDQSEPYRSLWQTVLETLGAEADGMSEISAKVRSALGGEELGQYTRIVVPGADGAALRAVIEEQYGALLGPDLVIENVVVGGKDVSAWFVPDQPQVHAYYAGDTFHLVLGPEDILELIIAELP